MKVFLDVDGVLLGTDRERPQRLLLADHALDFLAFALARAEVYWLTPHCRGDARAVVDHIVRHSKASDRERVMKLAPQVRATDYRGLRTEALPADGRFVWLDDAPEQGELAMLRGRGWLDRWLFVDTREEPEDLLRARQVLAQRLGGKAQSHGG
ncbi:MAG: hypothetical protein MUC36_00920 [Planctomycetes bacterium]|nr:hypothetical protein [Planctomycetota bacterium]